MDLSPTIKKVQQSVGVEPDGIAGPKTWAAISSKLGLDTKEEGGGESSSTGYIFDPRTEENLKTLTPATEKIARLHLRQLRDAGMNFRIVKDGATRTYERQNEIYAIGRTKPNDEGKWITVTGARGGYSNHNFGIAYDLTLFDESGQPVWESPHYAAAGKLGKALGLRWGGDAWKSRVDEPHFELVPSWAAGLSEEDMVAKLREDKAQGVLPA